MQEFVIPQQVLAATLPTSSPHPYVPWWDVRKVSKGVEGWGLLPTALPLSHHASQSLGRQEEMEDKDRLMSCTRGETNTNESKLKRGTNRK